LELDWFSAREDGLGNLYEGLLEKNAAETKSGAGQYFTPRPLIDCIVLLMKPQPGEVLQDPAAGTGGFIVAADHCIKEHTDDFSITADTSNKKLAFVEHVVHALKPGGRAAVVVPDNVLFEDNVGRRLRSWMMELCDLHTALRQPTGIFYAQGVKTNVLFFSRGRPTRRVAQFPRLCNVG
jgi:type I restriction-modification system DNA methylase subunit